MHKNNHLLFSLTVNIVVNITVGKNFQLNNSYLEVLTECKSLDRPKPKGKYSKCAAIGYMNKRHIYYPRIITIS